MEEVLIKVFFTYPNPCKDELKLHVDATVISSYEIIDCLGSKVLSADINNQALVKVNMSGIKSGIYIVRVTTPFGEAQGSIIVE